MTLPITKKTKTETETSSAYLQPKSLEALCAAKVLEEMIGSSCVTSPIRVSEPIEEAITRKFTEKYPCDHTCQDMNVVELWIKMLTHPFFDKKEYAPLPGHTCSLNRAAFLMAPAALTANMKEVTLEGIGIINSQHELNKDLFQINNITLFQNITKLTLNHVHVSHYAGPRLAEKFPNLTHLTVNTMHSPYSKGLAEELIMSPSVLLGYFSTCKSLNTIEMDVLHPEQLQEVQFCSVKTLKCQLQSDTIRSIFRTLFPHLSQLTITLLEATHFNLEFPDTLTNVSIRIVHPPSLHNLETFARHLTSLSSSLITLALQIGSNSTNQKSLSNALLPLKFQDFKQLTSLQLTHCPSIFVQKATELPNLSNLTITQQFNENMISTLFEKWSKNENMKQIQVINVNNDVTIDFSQLLPRWSTIFPNSTFVTNDLPQSGTKL